MTHFSRRGASRRTCATSKQGFSEISDSKCLSYRGSVSCHNVLYTTVNSVSSRIFRLQQPVPTSFHTLGHMTTVFTHFAVRQAPTLARGYFENINLVEKQTICITVIIYLWHSRRIKCFLQKSMTDQDRKKSMFSHVSNIRMNACHFITQCNISNHRLTPNYHVAINIS